MNKRVRLIRVLEYDYPDQETYEADIVRWQVPANGVRRGWGTKVGVIIRSATTLVETMPHQDESSGTQLPPDAPGTFKIGTTCRAVTQDITEGENGDLVEARRPCGWLLTPAGECVNRHNHLRPSSTDA